MVNTNDDWETFGRSAPYFGVLSNEHYRGATLDDASEQEFFETGRSHVDNLMRIAGERLGYAPGGAALDYGCGVGRISLWLAGVFDEVVGIDISPSMIREAERMRDKRGVGAVHYGLASAVDLLRPNRYDFVHSYIVLQHIPVARGERIIARLADALRPAGVGALHVTYAYQPGTELRNHARNLLKKVPLVRNFGNVALGRPWSDPAMQMNTYSLPRVLEILAERGIESCHVVRVHDWEVVGAFVLFRKDADEGGRSPWSNPAT